MVNVGYLLMAPDCTKSKEVYFPRPFREFARPCSLQARPDGRPDEDCCHTQSASATKCQTVACHARTHLLLSKVHQELHVGHGTDGTVVEKGRYILLE